MLNLSVRVLEPLSIRARDMMNTSTRVNEYLSPKYYNMSTRAVQRQVRVSLNGGADSAGVMEERWGEKGKQE